MQTALTQLVPLGAHMGMQVEGAGPRWVRVTMPFSREICNHVGNVYAGASYSFLELCGGAIMGVSLPMRWIPVIIGGRVEYPKAAKTGLVFDHEMAEADVTRIVTGLDANPRFAPEYELEATDEEGVVVVRATFTYRYLDMGGS